MTEGVSCRGRSGLQVRFPQKLCCGWKRPLTKRITPLCYGLVISLRSTQFPPALCEAMPASMNCTPRAPYSTVPSFDGCSKLCIEISSGLDPTLRMTAWRTFQQNRKQTHRYRHRCHGSERRDEVLPDNCYPNLNNRLNSNKGTKCEIKIKISTRRPFQRAFDSYPSNPPWGCHPIESDPVRRLSPIRF